MIEAMLAILIASVVVLSLRRAAFLVAAMLPPRRFAPITDLPTMTVLVPARDEQAVAGRLLAALARLEYGGGQVEFLLVCDGCVDGTAAIFHAWARERTDTRVYELSPRAGKAASLNAGLRLVSTELVTVLDADLEPRPDFLTQLARPFADVAVGGAAAFLRPQNADENIVTRYAAVTTWVHQLVTSAGTCRLGLSPPTFGAAAFRTAALRDIGGFAAVPAGEDVATSAALIRRGWRTRFVLDAVAENTVVSTTRDYWRQHVRWTRAVFLAHADHDRPSHASLPQRVALAAASTGYGDRLVFAVAMIGALGRVVPLWVPTMYLAVPAAGIVVALLRGGVRRRLPAYLIATALFFVADLSASVGALVIHSMRRPLRWQSPRPISAEGDLKL
jgi:cellulose synthase/poly-beta-1,6-N-acetylglucosamine synthase-like glycosyltransferase